MVVIVPWIIVVVLFVVAIYQGVKGANKTINWTDSKDRLD
jgi:hypothetical protein